MSAILFVLLVPRYSALGAAVATSGFNVAAHICYLLFTQKSTGVNVLASKGVFIYLSGLLAIGFLATIDHLFQMHWAATATLAIAAWAAIFMAHRKALAIHRIYPEAVKVPLIGPWLVAVAPHPHGDNPGTI
jgi:hypothetical protein